VGHCPNIRGNGASVWGHPVLERISASKLLAELRLRGIGFYCGVPDSLLKEFCNLFQSPGMSCKHVAAANEGNAIALAAGYYLGTGTVSAVYMQNSGLGNAVNPLVSLADKNVFRIPMLLIIGWRGAPGVKDEPQHNRQGEITPALLKLLDIPYWQLTGDAGLDSALDLAFDSLTRRGAPVALLVGKDVFDTGTPSALDFAKPCLSPLYREDAMRVLLDEAGADPLILSTTGKTSRELFELRKVRGECPRDFLTIGSMGHVASIALGVAIAQPRRSVICLDGDGSILMHMGSLTTIGSVSPGNLVHVMLNNAAYESVGGQPTCAAAIDWETTTRSLGYRAYFRASSAETLCAAWSAIRAQEGPVFLEVFVRQGSRPDLARPTATPRATKAAFMKHASTLSNDH